MSPSAHFEIVSLLSRFPLYITLCESLNYISSSSLLVYTTFPLHYIGKFFYRNIRHNKTQIIDSIRQISQSL